MPKKTNTPPPAPTAKTTKPTAAPEPKVKAKAKAKAADKAQATKTTKAAQAPETANPTPTPAPAPEMPTAANSGGQTATPKATAKPKAIKKPRSEMTMEEKKEIDTEMVTPRAGATRYAIAGAILKREGLENGITRAMVDELDAGYGKRNPRESVAALRNAWHAVNGYHGLAGVATK